MSRCPLSIPLAPPTTGTLDEAVDRLRSAPPDERDALYRAEVFPFAAASVRAAAGGGRSAAILFVPVGTQPYAPVLAALGTSAQRVALLTTAGSRTHADAVRETLQILGIAVRPWDIGDGLDGTAVLRAVEAALVDAGDPFPVDVVVDVTGGRKPTSAALGSLAAVRGYRQVYVASEDVPGVRGVVWHERIVELPDVGALLLPDERAVVTALLEDGAVGAALPRLERVVGGMMCGPAAEHLLDVARALDEGTSPGQALSTAADRLALQRLREVWTTQAGPVDPGALFRAVFRVLREEGAWR